MAAAASQIMLRTNSYYSSLYNLSYHLGLNRFKIAEANGFSAQTEFLPRDQPLLLPIDCKCNNGFFHADLTKTTIKGESLYGIAESLEGLTTCKAIRDKNPGVSLSGLVDKVRLLIPLRCSCPVTATEVTPQAKLLLSYPVSQGDTISSLAIAFNTTSEAIISANNRSLEEFKPESLIPLTSLLIPLNGEPLLGSLAKPSEPNLHFPESSIPITNPHKKKSRMWKIGIYIALSGIAVGAIIAVAATFLVIQMKKKKKQKQNLSKEADLELQQLSLSVRTASEKKVSFEGSQDALDGQIIGSVSSVKAVLEIYTIEELRKATEDFNPSNQIEGNVYHGCLSGKNMAIRRTRTENISKVELKFFNDATHQHPNIIRLLGTCVTEGSNSFLVFEYAKNGSLKDWLHGGLAMKNQFIASCYCFLTWKQRLRISLDVAVALQYMHQGMISPSVDIFAYGIVLLEILSGQTPISRPDKKGGGNVWLSEKIKVILQSDSPDELREWMDSAIGENYSFDAAVTLANLARACTDEDPSLRPSAGEIVEKLSRLMEESPESTEHMLICESSCKPLVNSSSANL
ncbi:hypothetical protein CCACVL1_10271 [Corchorus capsularis]|uniref:Protein kinase domain-containing protein n=1 Tax=Corchorus capsularis TaxID=210143 RepID=A0A1R3IRY8_COCAP|nr:hypothetical protein CCACVL1_10271 [Corchorus capsularis]